MPRVQLVDPPHKKPRLRRTLRALWRDTRSLWREFHRPILVFVIASIGGGYLYGILNALAGNEPIPISNLPYMMVALMVLETPIDMPTQPHLIVFWYAMPTIAIYIIGRGAVDFVRLFFDRSGRRAAWEEALARSTRNHVIVLGVGHVGLRVIRSVVSMGFEVVAVDLKLNESVDRELKRLNVPTILGDGRDDTILKKAGIEHCESMCICTSNDYINLQVAMNARLLQPELRIIARMWDQKNALCDLMDVEVLSASELAAPAFAGATVGIEVTQSLNVHGVDYSMLRLHVEQGSFLDGETIGDLQDTYHMDIVMHGRNSDIDVHPASDVRVQAGDMLVIFAQHARITELAPRNRPPETNQQAGR